MENSKNIFSYKKFWASRFGIAPFLPMSKGEMKKLGWDSCDIILVTGDAYVDHPSFGMAIIGRLLEAQGFRVGIISQPNWNSANDFKKLGKPNLFFGITAGNMDSMVNKYTADKKIRSNDAYSPNDEPNKRPDRATIVYAQRCREAFSKTPVIIGGIEASLRRIAHYDYWSEKIRRSILVDSKADMLIYGNAERAIIEVAHALAKNISIDLLQNIRGTAIIKKHSPIKIPNAIRISSYEKVKSDPLAFAEMSHIIIHETNPHNAKTIYQAHDQRDVIINPPTFPLTTKELDQLYELPFARRPHPHYKNSKIPAYEMIKFSVNILRGCFGGCNFCSITQHEGKIIQSRSIESVLREIEAVRDKTPGFTGIISDLGGPSANTYRMACTNPKMQNLCRKTSCIYPAPCKFLNTSHRDLITLYQKARKLPGIKKVLIGSGIRYDLALHSPEYIKELVSHHVGGYLKIAPEHVVKNALEKMQKPDISFFQRFKNLFAEFSKQAGKEQYLIPYFIAAHPGTTDEDMLELALWLKKNNFRLDQVQTFLPTPMTVSATMHHTEKNPLKRISKSSEKISAIKLEKIRKLHKAFIRYHAKENWPIIRAALIKMGRKDLIGRGKQHLVPP